MKWWRHSLTTVNGQYLINSWLPPTTSTTWRNGQELSKQQHHHRSPRPRKNVIAVTSTGIASTLLIDGATYHSQFKLYPPITETTRSKIEEGSYAAQLIRRADIIISDEATMKLILALDAINELLQTTMKNKLPNGGKVLLLGGDFRQCLPFVKHGNRVKVTEASIINNRTWPLLKQIWLVQNMHSVSGNQEFANWLINLGNGTLP